MKRISMCVLHFHSLKRVTAAASLTICVLSFVGSADARAQAILTAVNGDPITTFDVDEHAKLLKLSHKSASRNEAIESVVEDRLKFDEARHWGIDASDSDITAELARVAGEAKMQPQAWVDAVQRAKIDSDRVRLHLRSQAAWDSFVRQRNKTLGVSDEEINAQLAKEGTNAKITDYDLRQIVFVLPANARAAAVEGRLKEAQSLRNRFQDCESGLPLARSLPDVAVKEPLHKASDSLTPALRTTLADTPRGRLTAPNRAAAGIEMVAVCNKTDDSDATTLRERIQKEILTNKLETESLSMYKKLRASAVVSKG